ncbi:MAG TPA: NTP transferase domain-containing protein [Gemmatimonadales bacterium]|nr:NTP transferase domain-containing protein [Gemmatimonadales bacterium]
MPTLVALAAGMGSRFGGPKQLEPLGPSGETFLDFAFYDALNAGFTQAVLVVRPEMHEAFTKGLVARWRDRMPVAFVDQTIETAKGPVARTKPWGTGQAVLAAAGEVHAPFGVMNADDFYGAAAYRTLHGFLHTRDPASTIYAVLGFPLGATLAEQGGVNRAVLRVDPEGWLEHAEEVKDIVPGRFPPDTPVSMNMWGFTPAVFPQLAAGFHDFLAGSAADPAAEYLLPTVVERLIAERRARVRVLPATGPWAGLTHPEDRPRVVAFLRDLVERGVYPSPVWK